MKTNSSPKASRLSASSKTFRLVFSAVMLGLATALSMVKVFQMPMGGSITLCSMVPLVLVCQLYGFGWGSFTCLAYGLIQLLLGASNFSYATTLWAVLAIAVFDYVGAYWAVSLSSFTRKMKNKPLAAALGGVIACLLRYAFHFVSGAVVWGQWAEVSALPEFAQTGFWIGENALIYSYSLFYNAYMLPEAILTGIGAWAFMRVFGSKLSDNRA